MFFLIEDSGGRCVILTCFVPALRLFLFSSLFFSLARSSDFCFFMINTSAEEEKKACELSRRTFFFLLNVCDCSFFLILRVHFSSTPPAMECFMFFKYRRSFLTFFLRSVVFVIFSFVSFFLFFFFLFLFCCSFCI